MMIIIQLVVSFLHKSLRERCYLQCGFDYCLGLISLVLGRFSTSRNQAANVTKKTNPNEDNVLHPMYEVVNDPLTV